MADSVARVQDFEKESQYFRQKALTTGAVDTGEVKVLVGVRMFKRMARTQSGATQKQYSEEETYFPAQLLVLHNPAPDVRLLEKGPPTLEAAFPLNSQVVYIGPNYYGCTGVVTGHHQTPAGKDSKDKASDSKAAAKRVRTAGMAVDVKLTVVPMAPPFGRAVAMRSQLKFFPSYLVAKQVGIHPLVLAKITSSLFVNPGKVDIGLRLKMPRLGMVVPDYCRRVESNAGRNARFHHNAEDEGTDRITASQRIALLQPSRPSLLPVISFLSPHALSCGVMWQSASRISGSTVSSLCRFWRFI
jgi:5'-3' exoribonuclease 1